LPANTTAEIFVPAKSPAISAGNAAGEKFLRMENGCAVFETGSGDYQFESQF
jgi:hypothetical protein